MRKLFAVFVVISLLTGLLVFPVSAADSSGVCGENLTWSISATELPGQYQLTISGTGPMYDYSEENTFYRCLGFTAQLLPAGAELRRCHG